MHPALVVFPMVHRAGLGKAGVGRTLFNAKSPVCPAASIPFTDSSIHRALQSKRSGAARPVPAYGRQQRRPFTPCKPAELIHKGSLLPGCPAQENAKRLHAASPRLKLTFPSPAPIINTKMAGAAGIRRPLSVCRGDFLPILRILRQREGLPVLPASPAASRTGSRFMDTQVR